MHIMAPCQSQRLLEWHPPVPYDGTPQGMLGEVLAILSLSLLMKIHHMVLNDAHHLGFTIHNLHQLSSSNLKSSEKKTELIAILPSDLSKGSTLTTSSGFSTNLPCRLEEEWSTTWWRQGQC